jgi:hypothetical protein
MANGAGDAEHAESLGRRSEEGTLRQRPLRIRLAIEFWARSFW